jgi:hypothetical protein
MSVYAYTKHRRPTNLKKQVLEEVHVFAFIVTDGGQLIPTLLQNVIENLLSRLKNTETVLVDMVRLSTMTNSRVDAEC